MRYPAVGLALDAFHRGGSACAVLNAANEEAVHAFLDGKISFLSIEELVGVALDYIPLIQNPSLEDLIQINAMTTAFVRHLAGRE